MLFVFGDIHGCIEPFNKIIEYIEYNYKNIKFIFLGDYIDRGIFSKEVVDKIIELPYDKVCLMGNHEDMMIRYIEGMETWWLYSGNGGKATLKSFGSIEKITEYFHFFKNLKFLHLEKIELNNKIINLLFSHANVNPRFPVKEILKIYSYYEYYDILERHRIKLNLSNIWDRNLYNKPSGNFTVIHGHTPTFYLIKDEKANFIDDIYLRYFKNKIFEINLDTGLVYGNKLSVLKIPNNIQEYHENNGEISSIYCFYNSKEVVEKPLIKLDTLFSEE
ncbi:MAG: serine/threonine protein phosphatase [Thermosipho sp. (in: Bacteria)]|nr:serine/threonine protein phosphatase [Thermosipho sp. (in: thermotogales)]